ncbi:hypothetical protein RUE5091_04412 [Ruegeria denitrificans]|uniref:MBL fold metallo-hydrolase n=1 Tax=Ruegeria denitrificans TaxID=1715692 RepID=A0A0P1IKD9_9RHOB|nr:hypothetical protein [Ruegeria denitrificans]CUK19650.1 hypothetical protein RUE5091_04412 [Ruegeria denitrificans]
MNNDPKGLYGLTSTAEEFHRVSQENFIPSDRLQFSFTPTLVDTGSELVLFDTCFGYGGLVKALASVGVQSTNIDGVVITHYAY